MCGVEQRLILSAGVRKSQDFSWWFSTCHLRRREEDLTPNSRRSRYVSCVVGRGGQLRAVAAKMVRIEIR